MITYYKNVFLLLTTVAVNVGCQYLLDLEEYAPSYGNYQEPTKYRLPLELPTSEDNFHKLKRRNSDDISTGYDLSERKENARLEQIITEDNQKSSLYNRVRRGGVYGEKTEKIERKITEVNDTNTKHQRTRYASRESPKINSRNEKPTNNPDSSKLEDITSTATNSSRSRNLSNRRRNDQNQKRIVKKENFAESHFSQPIQLKEIEYIPNYNFNPVNIHNIPFQNDGQKFLHQLSSIQPQQFMNTNKQQLYQHFPSSTPRPYQELMQINNQAGGKLIINVPDEPQDYSYEKPKQIEQGFSYIHSQPHIKSQLENIQRYVTPNESPKIVVQNFQPPVYNEPQDQKKVEVYSNPNQPEVKPYFEQQQQYGAPKKETQVVQFTTPTYQPEDKINSNEENSGVITQGDGDVKYINYGYRHQNQQQQLLQQHPQQQQQLQLQLHQQQQQQQQQQHQHQQQQQQQQYRPQPNSYNPYNTQPNYGSNEQYYNFDTNNNYPQITEAQIKSHDKLNSQNRYPAILVHINGKTGLPFYPTSKNIFSIPHDAQFDYEGIPLVDPNKKDEQQQNYEIEKSNSNEDFRKEVYKSHYGYNEKEDEAPNAQRRLYTGLTFHASSRNLYDGKTPSLQNPPPRLGDVIWQAGDPITDPQETLVRQLNETCAYIQFNETTPGNEDGTKPNIWQAGDYSAQRQEEELIRSVNITCENYTTDALSNFTSGYTIIDYCSQCLDKYSEYDYEYDYNNQNQGTAYANPVEENYNSYYQPNQEQYQYYNDGGNIDPRLENGEIAGFYKRKRFVSAQDNYSKKE